MSICPVCGMTGCNPCSGPRTVLAGGLAAAKRVEDVHLPAHTSLLFDISMDVPVAELN